MPFLLFALVLIKKAGHTKEVILWQPGYLSLVQRSEAFRALLAKG